MALNVVADINAKVNQQSMSSALASMKTQFQGLGVDLKVNIPDLSKNANGFRLVADSVDKTTDSIKKFGEQSGIATKRLLAYSAAVTAILGPLNLLRNAVEEAVKFQREIIRVAQVAGDTRTELKSLQDQVTNLAKSYGVSSLELVKAATVFRQAGFSARETADSIEVLAKALLAPNFDNGTQIAETIVALKSQFKDAVRDAKTLQDTIGGLNAVAGAFAVEAKDLEETIKRTGGAFAAAGGNVNELVALFTSVRATTRESAETIATSFRTIFARLQRADIVDQLKSFGIELRRTREEADALGDSKLEGQFVGAYEAIRRLSAAVKDLPTTDSRFAAIAEEIGGYRQLSKTIPLLQQFATAQEALNVAQSGAASLNINAAQAQDAYVVKLQKLKEQLLELGRSIVNSQGFASFFSVLESGASSVLKLVQALTPLIPLLSVLATVRITSGLKSLLGGFSGGFTSQLDTQGRAIHRAGGGSVPGAGVGDTVPAMLTPGEYVLRKEAVQRIGVGTLNAMNAGKPQGYARGGAVQYFAEGGRVEKAVADVEAGKSIATAAKNANVGIKDLVKTLIEAGKLSEQGYASLSSKTKEYADSLKTAAQAVTQAATTIKAAAPVSSIADSLPALQPVSGLAGKRTRQRGFFDNEDILGPVGGLTPTASSGSRGPLRFGPLPVESDPTLAPATPSNRGPISFKPVPTEPEPNLAPLPPGVRGSRDRNSALRGNLLPSKPDILAGIENARLQGGGVDNPIPELIVPQTITQQKRLLIRELNKQSTVTPAAPPTSSKFGPREDAAFDFLGGATTDQSFKTPLKGLADSAFASGRKRKFTSQVLANLTDEERGQFSGLDEAGQKNLLLQKLKEQKDFNSRARDSRTFFNNKFEQDAIGPDGKKTDFFQGSERNITPLKGEPGFLGRTLSTVGSFAGGRVGAAGNFFKRNFNTVGLGAAFLGAEALNNSLGNNAITAEKAAQGAGVGLKQFESQEATKGALTGAQLGAGAGAAFGPIGIAVGAISGAILGYVDGIQEAGKKIAQVKLDESLTRLKTEIDDAALGKIGSSATDVNSLLGDARQKSFANTNKQLETSTSNKFFREVTFGLFGDKEATPEERARAQQENFKNQIGLQLPQLNQIAGRQASDFAKSRVENIGGPLTGLGLSVESGRFADQFKVANGELIKDIALIKGISVDKVVKEFQKQFEDQAKALSLAKGRSNARAQSENILNSVDRLSKAFDAAAEAANNSAKANSILTDVFGGSASAIQTRSLAGGISNLGVAGGTAQAGFKSSFGVIDNLVGSNSLRETTLGLNQARQVLPDALVNSLKSNPTGGDNFVVRLRSELQSVPKAIQDSIINKLEALDTAKLSEKLKESGEKLADELLQDFNPVKDALAKIANDVTANSNNFIAGLSQAGRNQTQVDSARGRVDSIALDRQRLAAGFAVSNIKSNNKFSDVGATDFVTEGQALNPFREGQRRLLTSNRFINQERLNIDAGFGRAGISEDAGTLSSAFEQAQAESKRLLAVREKNPTDAKAIENFNNVQQQANNIAQAMKNAAENTDGLRHAQERLTDITEKLNRFQASRQATGDFNKRVFRAQSSFDFKELESIDQGKRGANFLSKGGSIFDLQRIDPDVAKSTLDFAEANRNIIVGGKVFDRDKNSGEIKRDAKGNAVKTFDKNATLGQLVDEQFNPQGKGNDEKALQAQLKIEQDKALKEKTRQEENAKAYANILDKSNADFINSLRESFNLFGTLVKEQKDALERNIAGGQKRSLEADRAAFVGTAGVAQQDLGKLGITNQAQLDTIKAAAPDLARIAALKRQQDELENQRQQTIVGAAPGIEKVGGDLRNDPTTRKVAAALLAGADKSKVEFNPETQTKINTAIQNSGGDAATNAEISRRFQKQLIDTATRVPLDKINIGQVLKDATDITFAGKQDAIGNQLGQQQRKVGDNLRRGNLGGVANDLVANPENAQKILDASSKVGGSLDDVNKRLTEFDEKIRTATATLDAIGRGAPPVQNRAMGGPIFSPRGTDTVPAMLTPGEFVVRASSTRNNMALLNKINSSSGPVYAATGGVVSGGSTGVSFDSTGMKAAFDSFVSGTQALVSAMNAFPREITGSFTHRVEVIHNGIEVLNNLDEKVGSAVMAKVEKRFEDLGNTLRSQGFRV